MVNMDDDDLNLMWIGSFRYYLGRMTISVYCFCELMKTQWNDIPACAQDVIKRDLQEAIENDERDRKRNSEHPRLGADADRAAWVSVFKSIS